MLQVAQYFQQAGTQVAYALHEKLPQSQGWCKKETEKLKKNDSKKGSSLLSD